MKKEAKIVVDLFVFYTVQITKNNGYRFQNSDVKSKKINIFISELKKFIDANFLGEDYLRQYFEFQFNRHYKNAKGLTKGSTIQLDWIIGKKALSFWTSRTDKQKKATDYFVRKGLKTDIKIEHNEKEYSDS